MEADRVLVIGLDGADREVLIDGINRGELPTLASLASDGGIATLQAPVPPTTPVSMASVLTGRDPGSHGVFSFERDPREGGGYVGYDDIEGETLFDILDAADRRSVAINVPMTSPVPDTADRLVSGFPQRDSRTAEPPELQRLLRTAGYRVEPTEYGTDGFVDAVFDLAETRFDVARELVEEDWDLFFLMFTGDARLQHYIDDEDVVAEFYRAVDGYLADLLGRIEGEVTVLVVSDHGFHDLDCTVDLEAWLREEGDLAARNGGDWSSLYGELVPDRYDWDATTAYPGGAYLGNLYAEDPGDLRERLRALTHDGERVFREVHLLDDLYGTAEGPDIVPVPRRRYNYVAGVADGVFDEDPEEQKAPDREGVIIAGDALDLSGRPRSEDVLPTILDLLGVEADGFDGASLVRKDDAPTA